MAALKVAVPVLSSERGVGLQCFIVSHPFATHLLVAILFFIVDGGVLCLMVLYRKNMV